MAICSGLIDFRALAPGKGEDAPTTARAVDGRLSMPGLDLAWEPRYADIAASPSTVVLAWGRPRHPSRRAEQSDADWWLQRYEALGSSATIDVGGGFAAAIVDRARQTVLLLVDRFSIETICFRLSPEGIAFSDAASAVPGSARELDPQAIYDYLYLHVIPAPHTVYRDVTRLRAGHRLTAGAGAHAVEAWWTPRFIEDDRHDLPGRMRAFVDAVEQSVAEEADEPATACFLSGGTDSSTVAGMLRKLRGAPVHAYSIGFEAEGYDEMEYARIAARHFGLEHHEHYMTPAELADAMPRVAAHFDQPFGNSSVLPAYYCAMKAREDGFNRMLAGDGGDELFGGNARYATQKAFDAYHALPAPLRTRILEPLATGTALFRTVPGFKQLGGYVRHSRHPMPERMDTFNLLDRIGQSELLEPDFLAQVDPRHPRIEKKAVWGECDAPALINRMLAYDWKYTLADSDLPKVRAATSFADIQVAYPFLSNALTDLSLSLPPDWKLKGLRLRWFFKQALRGFLPDEILRKKKHGFGLPFGPWLLRDSQLRDAVSEAIQSFSGRGIVRPDAVQRVLVQLASAPGYYGEMVWILAMAEYWLRAHPAGKTHGGQPTPVAWTAALPS